MSNLYKTFGCKNKEELYEKVTKRDESVQSLIDFIEFSKTQIDNEYRAIGSPSDLFNYAKNVTPPTVDNVVLVFVDTKNQPVYQRRTSLSEKEDIKQALFEGLESGGVSIFSLVHSNSNKDKVSRLAKVYKNVGLETIDQLTCDKKNKSYYSEKGNETFVLDDVSSKVSELKNDYIKNEGNQIKDDEAFKEFTTFYAASELMNKNIIDQRKEITDSLKVGYQFMDQEVFGFLGYNENNEIIAVKELFMGGSNACIVDPKIIMKEALRIEGLKGYAVFHNHPSGIPSPSPEDEAITKRLDKINKDLQIEFLDHYIVGKKGVLSFAEKVNWFESHNPNYQTEVDDRFNKPIQKRHEVYER